MLMRISIRMRMKMPMAGVPMGMLPTLLKMPMAQSFLQIPFRVKMPMAGVPMRMRRFIIIIMTETAVPK